VQRVLVSSAHAARGLYTCKFFKAGRWRYVHVDDRVPCTRAGAPLYSTSPEAGDVLCSIIEKAYAKLHGSYEALADGSYDEALRDVTSYPAEVFRFDDAAVAPRVQDDTLWAEFADALQRGSVVGVVATDAEKPNLDPAAAKRSCNGILRDHAYAILDVRECSADATVDYDAQDVRLVKVANAWRLGGWNGAWSPQSPLWAAFEPIAQECGVSPAPAAATAPAFFWIEWRDLLAVFDTVVLTRCFDDDGARQTYRGRWVPGDHTSGAGGGPAAETWTTNPQYVFDVPEATRFCAVLTQVDARWHDAARCGAAQHVGLSVLKTKTGRRAARFRAANVVGATAAFLDARAASVACVLSPGSYCVVPAALGSAAAPFVLELFADRPIQFLQQGDDVLSLDDDGNDDAPLPQDAAAANTTAAEKPPPAHEPADGDVSALWWQASQLAGFLKELADANRSLADRVRKLELASEGAKPERFLS